MGGASAMKGIWRAFMGMRQRVCGGSLGYCGLRCWIERVKGQI